MEPVPQDSAYAPLRSATLARGRPALKENRRVAEDILRAAEACFADRNPEDVSSKEIAARAGTRPSMIHYYFGSKEGLLAEIIRRSVAAIQQDFLEMQRGLERDELHNPTREMIGFLAAVFHRYPTLCRILSSEQTREESPLIALYLRQWRGRARAMMMAAMTHLADRGYYRKDIDVERVFTLIHSVVFCPMACRVHLVQAGAAFERYFDAEWIDFASTVFDCYLRAPSSTANAAR